MDIRWKVIDDSEFSDFQTELRKAGRDLKEFDVSEEEDPPRPDEQSGVFVERGRVTVTNKKIGVSRTYDASGYGTHWVVDFRADLQAGIFGI